MVDIMERWNALVSTVSSINTALTPKDIRDNPDQYRHFVATNAGPMKAGWIKYLAGGAAAGLGFTGIQAIFQPYVAYETSKASTRAKYETELAAQSQYGGRSYIGQSSLEMGSGLMTGYGEQFIPNIQASTAEQARLYQQYAPYYEDVAVQKIWAEQRARYEANLAYPTFPVQDTEKANTKMPYRPRVI